MGYQNVYAFRDGIPSWMRAGYPVKSIEKLPKVEIQRISSQELKGMLDSGEDFVLLDMRPTGEVGKYWIETSNRLPITLETIASRYNEIPSGKKVVVVDLNGKRSKVVVKYLSLKGFNDMVALDGGMQSWIKDGNPIKKGI